MRRLCIFVQWFTQFHSHPFKYVCRGALCAYYLNIYNAFEHYNIFYRQFLAYVEIYLIDHCCCALSVKHTLNTYTTREHLNVTGRFALWVNK